MSIDWKQRRDDIRAWAGVALIHLALGYALFTGLSVRMVAAPEEALKLFTIETPVPPPPVREETRPASRSAPRREGAASPRNLKSRAAEVAAPPAPIFIPVPPPVVAAPIPATAQDRSSGASSLPGPGTGSGGQGTGFGSGSRGDGPGGGGGIGPRQIKGRIRNSDYPSAAIEAGQSGTVSVRYTVAVDGSVSRCLVTQSSGSRDLDDTTCRLIRERFRFRPARDASGQPAAADIVEDHEWIMEHVPDDDGR